MLKLKPCSVVDLLLCFVQNVMLQLVLSECFFLRWCHGKVCNSITYLRSVKQWSVRWPFLEIL